MADNVGYTPGSGAQIAADDIGGVLHQRMKISVGADGQATDVSAANPLPASDATAQAKLDLLLALLARESMNNDNEDPAAETAIPVESYGMVYDPVNNVLSRSRATRVVPTVGELAQLVRPMGEDITSCSFARVAAAGLNTPDMTLLLNSVSSSQASSNLAIVTNTTANAEWLARSTKAWTQGIVLRWQMLASQRIANNNFMIALADKIGDNLAVLVNSATSITVTIPNNPFTADNVGQFVFIGGISGIAAAVPGRYAIASVSGNNVNFTVAGWPVSGSGTACLFGWNHHKVLYTGTTATNAAVTSQRQGWAAADTTATINTTASPGHVGQIKCNGRDVSFSDMLEASSTGPAMNCRASRCSNIPDHDTQLYLYIWSYNGTTNPASNTTWTVGFWSVENTPNIPVTLAGSQLLGNAHPAAVAVVNTAAVNIGGVSSNQTVANGSTNRALGAMINTAVSNTDQNATAYAGSGRVNGTVVATGSGGGAVITAEINVTALTLGSATAVQFILQESRGGTNYTDIWTSDPITTTGITSVPAIPVGGRRRWVCNSLGGTSTTVTTTITALELPPGYVKQMYATDVYAATNPSTAMINSATTASTLVSTTLNSTSAPWVIEGCKQVSVFGVFTGGTPTTAPVYTLQVSNDGTNWISTATTFTPTAAGTFGATATGLAWRYARLIVSTASSGGTAYTVGKVGIYGLN